eukprot:1530566-Amphidinium_carterae.1
MDPVLAKSSEKYLQFVRTLLNAGLLTFGRRCQEHVTPFFVPKKSGALRIVWDCRIMNLRFKPPPEMPMATGAVLAE